MYKFLKRLKYPRLIAVLITYAIAIIIFGERNYLPFHEFLVSIGYFGTFIGGFFYVYELTAAPATAFLLLMADEQNIIIAALIGGMGALIADILLYYLIKDEMLGEIKRLSRSKFGKFINKEEKMIFGKFKKYFIYTFACILIGSPLPTEIGVTILASSSKISSRNFIILMMILHTLGILAVLAIGRII